jgi:hypothetical protein
MDPGQWWVPEEVSCHPQTTLRAVPVLCMGHDCQGLGKDGVVHGIPKGWAFEKRLWAQRKRNSGIRDRGLRWGLHLGSRETFYEALRQIISLEVAKQAVKSSVRLRKASVKTLWRSQPPSKQKKRLHTT